MCATNQLISLEYLNELTLIYLFPANSLCLNQSEAPSQAVGENHEELLSERQLEKMTPKIISLHSCTKTMQWSKKKTNSSMQNADQIKN